MLLPNNKVSDGGSSSLPSHEGQAMLDSLMKVVACYRHLASCVGGCTDSMSLRHELRQTCECAQSLVRACRDHLTDRLRDRSLSHQERKEAEVQWVAFSSCLELFHADMCKVYHVGKRFSVTTGSSMVQTGIQGGTAEVAARALSKPAQAEETEGWRAAQGETLEQSRLEEQIAQVDRTLQDMELKVNVLHWTVEARGPRYAEPLSSDTASSALLPVDEDVPAELCDRAHLRAVLMLSAVVAMAVVLSVSVVLLA